MLSRLSFLSTFTGPQGTAARYGTENKPSRRTGRRGAEKQQGRPAEFPAAGSFGPPASRSREIPEIA